MTLSKPPADAPGGPVQSCRRATLVSLAIVIPIGFCSKFYRGPAAHWVNGELGGCFYELFWCLLVLLIRPRARPAHIAGGVLAITCVLEFLQLWHPPWLEWVRGFFLGRTLIGETFDWSDFPCYFLGSAAGWYWLRRLTSPAAR